MSEPTNPTLWEMQRITLRDLFAAFALAGIRASESSDRFPPSESDRALALAYKDADAALKERAK